MLLFKKRKIGLHRHLLRGLRISKEKKNKYILENIFCDLLDIRWQKKIQLPTNLTLVEKSILINQNLWRKIGANKLKKKILIYLSKKGKFAHPMPKEWICILNKHNIYCNISLCNFLWIIFLFKNFCRDIFKFFYIILFRVKTKKTSYHDIIFFDDINYNNLPVKNCKKSYDFLSWFFSQEPKKKISTICSNANFSEEIEVRKNIFFQKNLLYLKKDIKNIFLFIIEGLEYFFISIKNFFLEKNFSNIILASEYLDYLIFKNNYFKIENLKKCIFHISNLFYRPLWTLFAEKNKINIIMIFYSTNLSFNRKELWFYKLLNWPKYYVWDEYQKDFLKKNIFLKSDYKLCNYVNFVDKKYNINLKKGFKNVAIFGVQPFRSSHIAQSMIYDDYYNFDNVFLFYEIIKTIAKNLNINLIVKRKRNVSKNLLPKNYLNYLDKLISFPNIKICDSDVSATRLIKETDGSIAMPLTSTALISKFFKKPVCYFDPSGNLLLDKKITRNILVCQSRKSLEKWMIKNIIK